MKKSKILMIGIATGVATLIAVWTPFVLPGGAQQGKAPDAGNGPVAAFTVLSRTQCIHTRKQIIAPAVLHPVIEVYVSPGDKVKKGQKLVLIDDDEQKADVRNREAILASATIALKEAKRLLASVESIQARGALPELRVHEVRTAALKAEKEELAAEAARDSAKAELEHCLVEAMIDGIVNRIDCYPGMVSRPGTTMWGEILDLREIDVVCPVTLGQCEMVKLGDEVEIFTPDAKQKIGAGKVVFIGLQVDSKTELVPVHVRLSNENLSLRCEAQVSARFGARSKAKDAK